MLRLCGEVLGKTVDVARAEAFELEVGREAACGFEGGHSARGGMQTAFGRVHFLLRIAQLLQRTLQQRARALVNDRAGRFDGEACSNR